MVVSGEGDANRAIVGCELEGVGEQVVDDALQFLGIGRDGKVGIFFGLDVEVDVLAVGEGAEGVAPLGKRVAQVELAQAQLQFAILEFTEVEHLVDEPQQHRHVFVDDVEQKALVLVEVLALAELVYRVGNECERCAEVVRHVGEESQFGMGGIFELAREGDELVALFLELPFLVRQFGIEPVFGPEGPHDNHEQDTHQHQNHDTGIEEHALGRVAHQEGVELTVEPLDFLVEGADVCILHLHDAGILMVDQCRRE